MHGMNAETYCTQESNTLSMTDHMTNKEHHAACKRIEIERDRSQCIMLGSRLAELLAAEFDSRAIVEEPPTVE